MLSVKQGGIKDHFLKKIFGMTQPGIEPRSPGLLANALPTNETNIRLIIKIKVQFALDLHCKTSVIITDSKWAIGFTLCIHYKSNPRYWATYRNVGYR